MKFKLGRLFFNNRPWADTLGRTLADRVAATASAKMTETFHALAEAESKPPQDVIKLNLDRSHMTKDGKLVSGLNPEEQEILRLMTLAGIDTDEIAKSGDVVIFHIFMSQDKFQSSMNTMPLQFPMEVAEVLLDLGILKHLSDISNHTHRFGISRDFALKHRLWVIDTSSMDGDKLQKALSEVELSVADNEAYLAKQKAGLDLLKSVRDKGSVI